MEENTNKSQTINIEAAPPEKAKAKLAKNLIILAIAIVLLTASAVIYIRTRPVPSITTGAIVQPVSLSPADPQVEINKLMDMNGVTGDGFQIKNVSRSTSVAVFLDKPYADSQAKFQDWLKSNGYGEILKEQIVFFHNP